MALKKPWRKEIISTRHVSCNRRGAGRDTVEKWSGRGGRGKKIGRKSSNIWRGDLSEDSGDGVWGERTPFIS